MSKPSSTVDLHGVMCARSADSDYYAVQLTGTLQPDGSMIIAMRGYRHDSSDMVTATVASETRETVQVDPTATAMLLKVFGD